MVPAALAVTGGGRLAFWLSTWFGCGLMPLAPGTWGALAALPLAALLAALGGPPLVVAGAALVFAAGWRASEVYMRVTDSHDPNEVVVDEVFGQCLTLAFVPVDPWLYLLGLALFRTVDILKFWPCNWIDRRLGGGAGVMVDDLVAALYAGPILLALAWWIAP